MNDTHTLIISYSEVIRGGTRILDAAELCVPTGATVGLIGLNGAGKSTLMMAIAGALADRSLTVTVRSASGAVKGVGYVPQQPRLPDWLTVGETARLYGMSSDDLVRGFPEFQFDLLLGRRIPELSGGQRQLLAVALNLLQKVDLTLLDEPLSALDIRRRRQLLERLKYRETSQEHTVRIISSQIAADIAESCNWLVVLRHGRVAFQGARDALSTRLSESSGKATGANAKAAFEESILELLGE
jgi:ABC-2 type transport system ATP-binding protein